jgi:hypothetical protein
VLSELKHVVNEEEIKLEVRYYKSSFIDCDLSFLISDICFLFSDKPKRLKLAIKLQIIFYTVKRLLLLKVKIQVLD